MEAARTGFTGWSWTVVLLVVTLILVAAARGSREQETDRQERRVQIGLASYYGPGFHGAKTASGEAFNQRAMTAAHRTLPLGSLVRVTNLENGRSVVVRINDRGPYGRTLRRGRIIDLSRGAAQRLRFIEDGVIRVRLEVLRSTEASDSE